MSGKRGDKAVSTSDWEPLLSAQLDRLIELLTEIRDTNAKAVAASKQAEAKVAAALSVLSRHEPNTGDEAELMDALRAALSEPAQVKPVVNDPYGPVQRSIFREPQCMCIGRPRRDSEGNLCTHRTEGYWDTYKPSRDRPITMPQPKTADGDIFLTVEYPKGHVAMPVMVDVSKMNTLTIHPVKPFSKDAYAGQLQVVEDPYKAGKDTYSGTEFYLQALDAAIADAKRSHRAYEWEGVLGRLVAAITEARKHVFKK